jgi:hypothetical protein
VIPARPQPAELRRAIYAAASKARLRRSDEAPSAATN